MDEVDRPQPLRLTMTRRAQADLTSALLFLDEYGGDAARRFTDRLEDDLASLCQTIADDIHNNGRPAGQTDPEASAFLARATYRYSLRTSKARRRNSTGLWYVYYCLMDASAGGHPQLLRVMRIRHGAAAPFTIEQEEQVE